MLVALEAGQRPQQVYQALQVRAVISKTSVYEIAVRALAFTTGDGSNM